MPRRVLPNFLLPQDCAGATARAPTQRHDADGTPRFGPDGAAYLVDYGAVRDPGGADPRSRFVNRANAPLVQIPGTAISRRARFSTSPPTRSPKR